MEIDYLSSTQLTMLTRLTTALTCGIRELLLLHLTQMLTSKLHTMSTETTRGATSGSKVEATGTSLDLTITRGSASTLKKTTGHFQTQPSLKDCSSRQM